MINLHIKPAAGRKVRKPSGGFLASAGEVLPWTVYWQRRLDDGDVVTVPDQPAIKPATKQVKS